MDHSVKAARQSALGGAPSAFALSLGGETVVLEPGKPWAQTDRFKWVTRGLIEEPQSFHVLKDGTVEINGEKIHLNDPEGTTRLEHEINKQHTPSLAGPKAPRVSPAPTPLAADGGKVRFKVRLDHLGHMMIEAGRGEDHASTGIRGLQTLVHAGLMLKPGSVHVDPLQQFIEIDGVRFECTEAGARQLEDALNNRYAPALKGGHDSAIEIRENIASPTGFDIHFVTVRAGVRFEVKEHLSQRILDILQDTRRCDLLKPGILLRLAPPHLLVRRRRPDGGEESVPEIPDVHYLHATAQQLEQLLNHPLIRRSGGVAPPDGFTGAAGKPRIRGLRVVRNPTDKSHLFLECAPASGEKPELKAFTHHNVVQLQQSGVFSDRFEVKLSIDHRTLSIRDKESQREETIVIVTQSGDEDLGRAGVMLTAALKTTTGPPTEPAPVQVRKSPAVPSPEPAVNKPAEAPGSDVPSITLHSPTAGKAPEGTEKPANAPIAATESSPEARLNQGIVLLFRETDPWRVNTEIFPRLAARVRVAIQDARLSLPRIFSDRRFEIVNFGGEEIDSVLELRSESFYGFYLSHLNDRRIDLVYACRGTHIEWGADKCVLQPSAAAEPMEFKGSALLGLAQTADNEFVFVVTPAYKRWVTPHEPSCRGVFAHFRTVEELAAEVGKYTLIWPEAAAPRP